MHFGQMLNTYNTSVDLELQQRSVEFTGIAQLLPPEVRAVIVERMPVVDSAVRFITKRRSASCIV